MKLLIEPATKVSVERYRLRYSGDIHTSSYSKLAGARQDLWRGNAPFAALLSDNVQMLKLLVAKNVLGREELSG